MIPFLMLAATGLVDHNDSAAAQAQPCRSKEYAYNAYTVCEVDLGKHTVRPYWKRSDGTPYAYLSSLPRALEHETGKTGCEQSQQRTLVDHFVGVGEQAMRVRYFFNRSRISVSNLISGEGPGGGGAGSSFFSRLMPLIARNNTHAMRRKFNATVRN